MQSGKMVFQPQLRSIILILVIISIMVMLMLTTDIDCEDDSKTENLTYIASRPVLKEDLTSVPSSEVMNGEPMRLAQNDKRIIQFIWKHKHLEPPSTQAYNLVGEEKDPSRGQGPIIRKLLKEMKNGFFVEAGALDGETRSNTLFLEQHLKWKGLLVEGDPSNYATLRTKNRKAWTSNTCLSVKPYPHRVQYEQSFNTGKIVDNSTSNGITDSKKKTVKVQCMPLFSLLSALNVSTVDYFSLDVEGSELKVLKTIPFDKVLIRTLSVEFEHTAEGKQGILKFMQEKGYKLAAEVKPPLYSYAYDVILVHKSVQ